MFGLTSGVPEGQPTIGKRWCRAGEAIVLGELVKWIDATELATVDNTVTDALIDSSCVVAAVADEPCAGVVLKAAAVGAYTEIQCSGYNAIAMSDNSVTEGVPVIPAVVDSTGVMSDNSGSEDAMNAIAWCGWALGADVNDSYDAVNHIGIMSGGVMLMNML